MVRILGASSFACQCQPVTKERGKSGRWLRVPWHVLGEVRACSAPNGGTEAKEQWAARIHVEVERRPDGAFAARGEVRSLLPRRYLELVCRGADDKSDLHCGFRLEDRAGKLT